MRIQIEAVALCLIHLWTTFCFVRDVTAHPSEYQSEGLRQASSPLFQVQIPPSIYDRVRSVIQTIISGTPVRSCNDSISLDSRVSNSSPPNTLLERYGKEVVLRFTFSSVEEAKALAEAISVLYLDVWDSAEQWVDVRLSKDVLPSLLGLLPQSLQTSHAPLMPDLARAIYDSFPSPATVNPSAPSSSDRRTFSPSVAPTSYGSTNLFFHSYQPLSVINPWLRLLTSLFPTHVRLFSIGLSYEGRKIPALRIGVHPTNTERSLGPRKTIIISGSSHAREWISTSTVNYVAYSLITSYGKSKTMTRMLEEFDWILIPSLNPDGYVYTWETDRLWRKNRQQTAFRFCKGLDLDRSYGFEWDAESSKNNPCSESFAGEEPFEGAEALVFAKWARNETENNNVKFVGFLDFHSYSQRILYPYSYSCISAPPSLETLEELGLGLAKAMRNSDGEVYGVTSACEGRVIQDKICRGKIADRKISGDIFPRMETGGGSALDWFYHELRVHYAYQIKLRDTGSYGFLLPSVNIVPTGKEAFRAVTYMGKFLLGVLGLDDVEEGQIGDQGKVIIREPDMVEDTRDNLVATDVGEEVSSDEVENNISWELRRQRQR